MNKIRNIEKRNTNTKRERERKKTETVELCDDLDLDA